MARYAKEHKEATRQRIIESASRRLKLSGVDGSGIATLMADAGLTNGAFYAHFTSKDDLVATVVAEELHAQAEAFKTLPPGRDGLAQFVRHYLTVEHRDNPSLGCPSAALLDEIARSSDITKQVYTDGARTILDEVAVRLCPADPQSARGRAIALYTMMIGTLQLSRAVADQELSSEILARGIENADVFLG